MTDICYLTFQGDVITEPIKSEKGSLFFIVRTSPGGVSSIDIRVMLKGPAAEAIVSAGDKIHITNGSVYVGKDSGKDYLFNVAVNKAQFIHVVSYDDGIKHVEDIQHCTGGF